MHTLRGFQGQLGSYSCMIQTYTDMRFPSFVEVKGIRAECVGVRRAWVILYIYNPARLLLWPVASACHTRAMSQGCVPGRLLMNTSLIMLHGSTGGCALGGVARRPPVVLNMGLPSRRPSAIGLDTVDSWRLPRDTLNPS